MKITKRQLRRIIKEEKTKILKEGINQSALLEREYFNLEDAVVIPVRELIRSGYTKEELIEALTLIVQDAL
jgi:hypothetical protein